MALGWSKRTGGRWGGWAEDLNLTSPFSSVGPHCGTVCGVLWRMLQRARLATTCRVGRWALHWGTRGKRLLPGGWGWEGIKPAQSHGSLRGLMSADSTRSKTGQRGYLLPLHPALWKNLLHFCAVKDLGENLSCPLASVLKGRIGSPSSKSRVKLAEEANGQGQLCPADKCPLEGSTWVAWQVGRWGLRSSWNLDRETA